MSRVLSTSLSAPAADGRGQRQVVAAGVEVGGAEGHDAVAVAQAEQRGGREMRAGALAADDETVGAEQRLGLAGDPQRRRLAVVRTLRIGMLGGEAVIDGDAGHPGPVGKALQPLVLLVDRAEHPAAAMDVKIDAPRRPLRRDDPEADGPMRAVDGHGARPRRQHRRGESAAALAAHLPDGLGRMGPIVPVFQSLEDGRIDRHASAGALAGSKAAAMAGVRSVMSRPGAGLAMKARQPCRCKSAGRLPVPRQRG